MLLDLIGQDGFDAIVEAMAECRLVHLGGACSASVGGLFSAREMELLLLRDGIGDCLDVMVNGRSAHVERLGVLRNGRLKPLALRNLTRQGASLIFSHLERHHPPLWRLACDAERMLQDRIRIQAVASYNRLPALKAHYDPWDLIIIQVDGTKKWNLFGQPVNCAKHFPELVQRDEVTTTLTMEPGDVLLVPAGLTHQCEADSFSLHLALAVERATLHDLVQDLFDRYPSLNRPLRAVLGGVAVTKQVAELREELSLRLDQTDAAAWLSEWNTARGRVTGLGLGPSPSALDHEMVATLAVTIFPTVADGGRCRIGGIELELTADALIVIDFLRNGPRRVGDLIQLTDNQGSPEGIPAALEHLVDKGIVQLEPRP
jgi:hypothetical protein